jgi:hypothetical protein
MARSDGDYISEDEHGSGGEEFPESGGHVVDFGPDEKKPVTGRRKTLLKKVKAKPGSFGELLTSSIYGHAC